MDAPSRTRPDAKTELLEAAKRVLLVHGYTGLSTRAVATEAGTQMSQIRYHFGSKQGMILGLFEYMNSGLISRQSETFLNPDLSLSRKWELACDYLEDDLASGYVKILHELTAVGWSDPEVGEAIRTALTQWADLIRDLARQAERQFGSLGPFSAAEVAALVGPAFLGTESLILLGYSEEIQPSRAALRKFGKVIEYFETMEQKEA